MVQSVIVDVIVLVAAAWLFWSFAPASWRSAITRRRALPAYDTALQADELAGQHAGQPEPAKRCGDDGCC